MLTAIAECLSSIEAPGSFASRRNCSSDDLHLEVVGVGPIRFPISSATARKLCAAARPARYGLKEKTLLDTHVRHTWEIEKSRIKIDQRRWKPMLIAQIEQIKRDLGLPGGCILKADLHNMLLYEHGQFFVSHQDSEKANGMIGTLVVTLPSPFKGGAFVIEHRDKQVGYRGSGGALSFIAFYADCHHEVKPVTDGYRVVLTYNLILEGNSAAIRSDSARKQTDSLAKLIRSHFETAPPPRWPGQDPQEPPDRLIYLLDHQYTQKGLGWSGLKNGDAARAAALREVAVRLDCEIFLALAEVHETWSCEDEWEGHVGHDRRWQYDEEEEEEAEEEMNWDTGSSTLTELIDSDLELRHLIDPSGRKADSITASIPTDEICCTTESVELEPFNSEHEGYMGNWGNTVDRWYHRAAVVLWPRERTFILRSKASAVWAIEEMWKIIKAGKIDEARTMAKRVLPFWKTAARREDRRRFVLTAMRVADAVDAPDLGAALLQPLRLERLSAMTAPQIIALLQHYGLAWSQSLFAHWSADDPSIERRAWVASMPSFCRPLCSDASTEQLELVRSIVTSELKWVANEYASLREQLPGKDLLDALFGLHKPILGLLESSVIAKSPELQGEILGLLSVESDTLLPWVIRLLRTASGLHQPRMLSVLGFGPVQERCIRALTAHLRTPPRRPDDWSIDAPMKCACDLCKDLASFLTAPNRIELRWPLAKARRAHIHRMLQDHDIPVRHETVHTGTPHVLVLRKKKELFKRAAAARMSWTVDLRWLTRKNKNPAGVSR